MWKKITKSNNMPLTGDSSIYRYLDQQKLQYKYQTTKNTKLNY